MRKRKQASLTLTELPPALPPGVGRISRTDSQQHSQGRGAAAPGARWQQLREGPRARTHPHRRRTEWEDSTCAEASRGLAVPVGFFLLHNILARPQQEPE